MPHIIETLNPFQPLEGLKKHEVAAGVSIREWLQKEYPGFTEFEAPTICLLNGEPLLRKDWDYVLKEGDIVNFIRVAGGPVFLIISIVLALVSVALGVYAFLNRPKTPGATPNSPPVFTIKGQTNTNRILEPIEVNYGKNRIYPSLASEPYYLYNGNDQYLYLLLCVGQGYYDIESFLIGDSPISSYPDVEYEIVLPGHPVTLFQSNVYVSTDAGGQQLYGPNEPQYVPPGWVGPFVTCPAGTKVTHIDIDLTFPKGIYHINSDGSVGPNYWSVLFQASLIDDNGNQIGDWFNIYAPGQVEWNTTTPWRLTVGSDVSLGRYQVRGMRNTDTDLPSTSGDDVVWDGMSAYMEGGNNVYGDVTVWAIKARATNVLNDSTQQKFNLIATRMLPVRGFTYEEDSDSVYMEDSSFERLVATRSIVWAFVDIFMAAYGGNLQDDSYFDWDALNELDALYRSRGEYFDWTFRDPITVWEAATAVALVGRAVPMIVGSQIAFIRDGSASIPVTLFTPENIIAGTFEWDITLWSPDNYDSVEVTYTDPETGYQQEQVLVSLPGGTTNYPNQITYNGIADRTMAYRFALYQLAVLQYITENIIFQTGMEGFIPSYGDLIAVSYDATEWGQSGFVVAVEELSTGSYLLYLSEPPVFSESNDYQIYLRLKNGDSLGPIDVQPTSDPLQVEIILESDVDFLLGGTTEPMLFLFGIANQVTKLCKVIRIEPQGGEAVKITAVNYNDIVYSFDSLLPIPLGNPAAFFPAIPNVFTIENLTIYVVQNRTPLVQISWTPVRGALYYGMFYSYDSVNWYPFGENIPSASLLFDPPNGIATGDLFVQVYAVTAGGNGHSSEAGIQISQVTGLVVLIPWSGLEWEIGWLINGIAAAYLIKVYDNTVPLSPILKRTVQQDPSAPGNAFDYNYTMAEADGNVVRNMLVKVDTMYWDNLTATYIANGTPSSMAFSILPPVPPSLPSAVFFEDNSAGEPVYKFSWTNPPLGALVRVRVWVSLVDNFDPTVVSPVYDDTASAPGYLNVPSHVYLPLELDSDGYLPTYYWRVCVSDVWGNEILPCITAQQIIA